MWAGLLAGKGTKEVSDEKQGVGMTRIINMPVKKAAKNLRKKIDGIDKAFEKLDRLSVSLDAGKEAEKGGRVSVKDKLSQMKEKAGQRKVPEPDKVKPKKQRGMFIKITANKNIRNGGRRGKLICPLFLWRKRRINQMADVNVNKVSMTEKQKVKEITDRLEEGLEGII